MVKRYVMASVNARYKGLITTITRILHFGEPRAELLKQFGQNLEIENRMIAATQVGKPMSVVFDTAVEAYRQYHLSGYFPASPSRSWRSLFLQAGHAGGELR